VTFWRIRHTIPWWCALPKGFVGGTFLAGFRLAFPPFWAAHTGCCTHVTTSCQRLPSVSAFPANVPNFQIKLTFSQWLYCRWNYFQRLPPFSFVKFLLYCWEILRILCYFIFTFILVPTFMGIRYLLCFFTVGIGKLRRNRRNLKGKFLHFDSNFQLRRWKKHGFWDFEPLSKNRFVVCSNITKFECSYLSVPFSFVVYTYRVSYL